MKAKIIIRATAQRDLEDIEGHYIQFGDGVLENIGSDINAAFDTLETFPKGGQIIEGPIRHFVTTKYRFTVDYRLQDGDVHILGIYRYQNRP
ncbi:MAG: type II toxin-antitoxin system RelE/ParE family toxin [Litorimonas sp.]